MTEVQEELKQYQWKKGDNFGEVVDVASDDGEFVNFTNGQRIFKSVLSEFLDPVVSGNLPFPPTSLQSKVAQPVVQIEQPKQVDDKRAPSIMGAMILKMSKKNVVNVPIQINLNIPTPTLYAMLGEGMEEEDLNDEITEVALSQIKIDKLQEYIKLSVTDFLSEYYS
jgi:hypothetical protein